MKTREGEREKESHRRVDSLICWFDEQNKRERTRDSSTPSLPECVNSAARASGLGESQTKPF